MKFNEPCQICGEETWSNMGLGVFICDACRCTIDLDDEQVIKYRHNSRLHIK